jgi:lactoylglutathione lyase
MKLNHINLTVTDVEAASNFLVKYFGMRSMGGNKGMGFLTDEEDGWGFVLTLMKATEGTQAKYPGSFHIGFFIGRIETVDELYRRLKEDGFEVPSPEDTGHSYGFYVKAPGGFTVEIGA